MPKKPRGPYRHSLTVLERAKFVQDPTLVEWVRAFIAIAWVNPVRPGEARIERLLVDGLEDGSECRVVIDIWSPDLKPRSTEWVKYEHENQSQRMNAEMRQHDHSLIHWISEYRTARGWTPPDGVEIRREYPGSVYVQGIIDDRVVRVTIQDVNVHRPR